MLSQIKMVNGISSYAHFECVYRRGDLTEGLMKLKCRTLIIVGENSPFHCESVHMSTVMSRRYQALIEVNLFLSLLL